MNKTTKTLGSEFYENEIEHRYGGNGYVLLAEYPDEWAIIAGMFAGKVRPKMHTVWTKALKVAIEHADPKDPLSPMIPVPLSANTMAAAIPIREKL